ncbi:MAG: hypothetical protein ACLRXC_12695 [[Clostridium] leptum]
MHQQADAGDGPRESEEKGLAAAWISLTTLVFSLMAAMAMMMKNLDSSFSGERGLTLAMVPPW